MEWKKKEKGSVLVGHHGNLYKKLNVRELFATGDTFAPSLRLITEADDLVIRHHTENNHHLTPT